MSPLHSDSYNSWSSRAGTPRCSLVIPKTALEQGVYAVRLHPSVRAASRARGQGTESEVRADWLPFVLLVEWSWAGINGGYFAVPTLNAARFVNRKWINRTGLSTLVLQHPFAYNGRSLHGRWLTPPPHGVGQASRPCTWLRSITTKCARRT